MIECYKCSREVNEADPGAWTADGLYLCALCCDEVIGEYDEYFKSRS